MGSPEPALFECARCDLHVHTNRSDGRYPFDEVLRRAAARALDVLAVTDHDAPPDAWGPQTVDGHPVHLVAGAEVSVRLGDTEQHILVYFPGAVPDGFRALCAAQRELRARRWDDARAKLQLDAPPAAEARAGDRSLTRFHLAQAMVAAGRAPTIGQAFRQVLGDDRRVVDNPFPAADALIGAARALGGLPVWAHPGRRETDRWLDGLAAAGLVGVEAFRPANNAADRKYLRKRAQALGLVLTGGSDWHGWHEPPLGTFAVTGERARAFVARLDRAA